ncbi:MAG: cytochrome c oxidase subunit 3, partial [Akkermansiaceae bacterium]
MEIPYVVEPRKDTGLNNSKIGIWLFLASEVMLFGGLFSGYVFLRIYADYPWPERTLPILPGLINTFVLIGSSVTVVFAWVSLKLRQWRKFQIYMTITLICAALFMVLKGFEYKAKFHHQAVRTQTMTVIEGHAHPQGHSKEEGAPTKNFNIDVTALTIDLERPDKEYFQTLEKQYTDGGFALADEVKLDNGETLAKGTKLTWDTVTKAKASFKDALAENSNIAIAISRDVWKELDKDYPGKNYYEAVEEGKTLKDIANERIKKAKEANKKYIQSPVGKLIFVPSGGKAPISFDPSMGKLSDTKTGANSSLLLKDKTSAVGITTDSSIIMHVDAIDFRHTVMEAKKKGIDPQAAIDNSWLLTNPKMKALWEKHLIIVSKLEERIKDKGHEPTETEKLRMGWQEIAAVVNHDLTVEKLQGMTHDEITALYPGMIEGFTGADHKKTHYPELTVPREQVRFESVFSPKWNTYYATYFTITGLHGLHVIAGALVLDPERDVFEDQL